MKAIALDAAVMQGARDGETADDIGVAAMEGGVERRDVGEIGSKAMNCMDEAERLRLMERCGTCQCIDVLDHGLVEQNRTVEHVSTMKDAIAGGTNPAQIEEFRQPAEGLDHDGDQIAGGFRLKLHLERLLSFHNAEDRRGHAEVDDRTRPERGSRLARREEIDLDRRGAGVEGEQEIGTHDHGSPASGCGAATGLASAAEAIRAVSGSVRLVSTIGMRAPSTIPAALAPAK